MRWRLRYRECSTSVHVSVQPRIGQRLKTIFATFRLRIEGVAPQIADNIPISIAFDDVAEPLPGNISHVELSILRVEFLTTRRDEA